MISVRIERQCHLRGTPIGDVIAAHAEITPADYHAGDRIYAEGRPVWRVLGREWRDGVLMLVVSERVEVGE